MLLMALRQALPKYISEIRLLLDFGSVRIDERLIYQGLPMKVVSIKSFAILQNPELHGIVRIPLASLSSMVSRPAINEIWFPCQVDDVLLFQPRTIGTARSRGASSGGVMECSPF